MNARDDREVAAQARASLRAVASVIDRRPPLRLPLDASPSARRSWWQHRWVRWTTPLAAAASVIAVTAGLVIARGTPASEPVPPSKNVAVTASAPPRYYAALDGRDLVVGDTYTGKAVARFVPPAHRDFQGVSAAADDRTFVAFTMPPSGSFKALVATWYEVRLTPGAATPATLTRLPIAPAANVVATALSASGREVAVGFADYVTGRRVVSVYSVATGRLLKSWHTADSSALEANAMQTGVSPGVYLPTVVPALTWIDGDRAIAFAVQSVRTSPGFDFTGMALRRLDVASTSGDLMADSRVIWSISQGKQPKPSKGAGAAGCFVGGYPVVSANGASVLCTAADVPLARATGQLVLKLLAYPTTTPAIGRTRFFQIASWKGESPQTAATMTALWTDPTGSVVLVNWWVQTIDGKVQLLRFGYVHGGLFTPVPVPVSTRLPYPPIIAW
jgi:hypothetical protein